MKKMMDRIARFVLSEETIFHVIELSDRRKNYPDGSYERSEAYEDLQGFLSMLADRELQELMCLMDFGRNMSYGGYNKDVVEGFITHVDTRHFGCIKSGSAANYLAGKVPLGDWLRLVLKEIRSADYPDDFYRLVFFGSGDGDHSVDFQNKDEAWTALQNAINIETAEKYHGLSLIGYSLTGRAETRLATVNFE